MSLEGILADFSIVEILQLLQIGKKTGVLKFKEGEFEGVIAFDEGLVYYAESSGEKGTIADRLIRERKISSKSIRQAQGLLKIKKDEEKSLADVLIENKFVDARDLELSVKNVIIDAIFDIGLHKEAQFVFFQNEKHEDELAFLRLTSEEIGGELVRREKTWEAIKKKVPDLESVYVLSPEAADEASEIRLRPLEWKVICLLDGESTLQEICKRLEISPFKAGKIVYGLLAAGLIKPHSVDGYVADEYFVETGSEG